ncbi:MAG TPA: 3-phenylpropionate MFS transporter [Azospirillaceae bacterium]|nr:3-phenylpropionate MFS transporter [Azospirillaceae bacterium]
MARHLSILFFVLYSVVAVQLPFWPVWLAAQGLDAAWVGLVASIAFWTKPFADVTAGVVVDRTGSRRRAMLVLAAVALAGAGCFLVSRELAVLVVASVLWTGAFGALGPLADNVALLTARARGLDYGRMRVWGSVGFVATTLAGGRLLEGRDADIILYALMAGLAAAWVACLPLADAPPTDTASANPPAARRISPRPLLRHPVFLLFLATAIVLQPSHAVLYGFGTLHWRDLGLSGDVIGLLWVEGVLGEIVLFAFGRRLVERVGAPRLLLLAAVAGLVRWTVLAWADNLPAIVAVQALHGLTFGASHLGAMRFLAEAVPITHSATAQTLYSGLALGIGFGVLLALSGPLYEMAGGHAYLAMTALCAVAVVGAVLLARRWRPGETLVLADERG